MRRAPRTTWYSSPENTCSGSSPTNHKAPHGYSLAVTGTPALPCNSDTEPSAAMTKAWRPSAPSQPCTVTPSASRAIEVQPASRRTVTPGSRRTASYSTVNKVPRCKPEAEHRRIDVGVAQIDQPLAAVAHGEQAVEASAALDDGRQQPEARQHRLSGRLQRDAGADGTRIGHPLVDRDGVAGAGQEHGGGGAGASRSPPRRCRVRPCRQRPSAPVSDGRRRRARASRRRHRRRGWSTHPSRRRC